MKPPAYAAHLLPQLEGLAAYQAPAPAGDWIRLHANECPEPWPEEVMDDLARVVRGVELGRYPDASGRPLRVRLAQRLHVTPDEVVVGNGSDEIISLLVVALSGGGGRVVLPRPTFVMYGHTARVHGMEVVEVDVRPDLGLDAEALDAALASPRAALCFLARPNNPTGTMPAADLVLELAARHPHVVVVVDEAYIAYSGEPSLVGGERPENLVGIGTLSKVGLAALRVGYCVAHPILTRALDKVRHPYNVSQTSLALALRVLERHERVLEAMVERAVRNRERLARILARLPGALVYPSAANMVLARLPSARDAAAVTRALWERRILVKDLSGLPGLPDAGRSGYVRASVGTARELDRLEAAVGEIAAG